MSTLFRTGHHLLISDRRFGVPIFICVRGSHYISPVV